MQELSPMALSPTELTVWSAYVAQVITGRFDVDRPADAAQFAAVVADAMIVERRRHATQLQGDELAAWDSYFANLVTRYNLWDGVPRNLAAALTAAAQAADAVLDEQRRR
jgi:hypothetical protein